MQLITQSGDLGPKWFHIALRALAYMGQSSDQRQSGKIAEILGEDPTFVRKILAKLAKAGLVATQGGRYGGYRLNKHPRDITVLSVYKAFETYPQTTISSVPSTGTEVFISLLISKAEEQFQSILANYTIEDIIKNRRD
jgi:Rrf2 family protein